MSVVQLRRYQLAQGTVGDWSRHWQANVRPLREAYGFQVLFAYADHANDQFVWAVRYDGTEEELKARDREYHDSPEWAARNAGKNGPIQKTTIAIAEELVRPDR